jgi:hypothetical protein
VAYPQPPTQLYPFSFPGQYTGVWNSFDPTAGSYTYDVGPGFALGGLWFPNLTDAVQIYAGDTTTGSPFYTTGNGGAELVPMPSGTLAVTLLSVDGTGAVMPVYVTSLTFDPIKTTPTTAAISSVTATAPITSSGGANPNIALTTPLAIGYGGTGSAAPSLVAGSGVSITGAWPNQTISTTASSGVTSVGATSPLASSGGTTPILSLTGIVAIAHGGTGTASPSLVAGQGITLSGSWPNQTVTAVSTVVNPTYGGFATTGTGGSITITVPYGIIGAAGNVQVAAGASNPYIIVTDAGGSNFAAGIITFVATTNNNGPGSRLSGIGFTYVILTNTTPA